MKWIAAVFLFAAVGCGLAACGGDDKKPPMMPDGDKPVELADAGATTTPPVAK